MKRQRKAQLKLISIIALIFAVIFIYVRFFNGAFVYITFGLSDSTFMKVGNKRVAMMEANILLSGVADEYEGVLGSSIWEMKIDGTDMESYAKEQVKSKLARVYCMNLYAKENGVVLSRSDNEAVALAADEIYAAMSEKDRKELNVTKEKLQNMVKAFAIAQSLYEDMTSGIDIEVSSDEARVISVQYISSTDENEVKKALKRVEEGELFYTVARELNEDDYESELRREQTDELFEKTAFDLLSGEVSDIIKCGDRYYVIKCVSDNDMAKTEANKREIVERRKLELFNQEFEKYESKKYVEINSKIWNKVEISDVKGKNVNFDEVFGAYFG